MARYAPKVAEIERIIEEILKTKAPFGEWSNEHGQCINCSKQLKKALKGRGITTECHSSLGHVFLKYTNGKKPIYIDPTYKQLFAGLRVYVPDILVGTEVMIKEFFEKYQSFLVVAKIGVDVHSFVEDQYVNSTPGQTITLFL